MLREVFEKGKELADKVTNIVMNYTDVEAKVRSATNDDPWGPHGQDMHEIAEYTKHYDTLTQVMGMLWRRMFYEQKSNWRRTYKSLLLLSYLLRNGSERIVVSCKEHIYDLRLLESYQFIDENGKDQGVNIRHKAKDVISILENDFRLTSERKKAAMNRNKFQGGISSNVNGHHYYEEEECSKSQPTLCSKSYIETGESVKKKTETTKPVELAKPEAKEIVGDLLDFDSSFGSPSAQNISHTTSTVIDNTFDPFNLNTEIKSFTAPPIPSQPTSPVHLNNNTCSDDFDNFVSAPLPPTTISSNFNDLNLLFQNANFASNDKRTVESVFDNNNSKIENKTPKIGATWTNMGSIDISLDLLSNRNRQINSGVSSSRSLNQLQRESCNKPNAASKNNFFSTNATIQKNIVMNSETRFNNNYF